MSTRPTPARVAAEIRSVLRRDGSVEHAKGVQWFFKEEIRSHGWYTGDLRRLAAKYRPKIQKEFGLDFLVNVANKLFAGRVLEEKSLLGATPRKADQQFRRFAFCPV
jgi:hypothetical protein